MNPSSHARLAVLAFSGVVGGLAAGGVQLAGCAGETAHPGSTGTAGTSAHAGTTGNHAGVAGSGSGAGGSGQGESGSGGVASAGTTGAAGTHDAAGSTGAAGALGAAGSGTPMGAAGSGTPMGAAGSGTPTGAAGSGTATGVAGSGTASGAAGTGAAGTKGAAATLVLGPYKDTSINMNWNTNVISTKVGGDLTTFVGDMSQNGKATVTLSFATGECGSENWGGVKGSDLAAANVPMFNQAGVHYMLSTGGAAGSFTCALDTGMSAFIDRWASPGLVGVDFDIEAGQSPTVIANLMARIKAAHGNYPKLRFSLTLATLAPSAAGSAMAQSLGANAQDSFNTYGDQVLNAVKTALGFSGAPATWPTYVTVNLMTMDYGAPAPGICVVSNGACQMGQSAIQAAYNLHDKWGVPYSGIELTPMIGGNDAMGETFTLSDADTVTRFALAQGLAGVHYWSYDRDADCTQTYASPTCNSVGGVGAHGYLKRFQAAGLK